MSEIISLLWVVVAILLLCAVMYVLYNPPKTLLKLRHKDSELQITAPPTQVGDEQQERELDRKAGKPPERDKEGAPVEEDTPFARAYLSLMSGNYTEGMVFFREEAEHKSERERVEFLAFGQHLAATGGSDEAFEDLRKSASAHPEYSMVAFWLGLALRDRGDVDSALSILHKSQRLAVSDSELTSASIALAGIYDEHDDYSEAIKTLTHVLPKIKTRTELSRIYARLAALYREAIPPQLNMAFAMYELSIESDPTNEALRFGTAYALSNVGADAQALFHYITLLSRNPSYPNAANNTGVSSGQLDLHITQVRYYRNAASLGETLPMANLAGKLIDAGFVTEARELVDSALTMPDPHRNVLQAMGRIADFETEEDSRLESLQKRAAAVAKWRVRYGKAALDLVQDNCTLSGRFSDGSITVEVEVESHGQFHGVILATDRREFSGKLLGAAGEFSWNTVTPKGTSIISSFLGKQSGKGVWIFNIDSLVGYVGDETGKLELDLANSPSWALRELRRVSSVGNQEG